MNYELQRSTLPKGSAARSERAVRKRYGGAALLAALLLTCTAAFAQTEGRLVNFDHLDHLSQMVEVEGEWHRGVWIYAEPGLTDDEPYLLRGAPGEGEVCVDDVARAAIVYLWGAREGLVEHGLLYARQQLDFVLAMQAEDGEFFNFVFEDGRINRVGITSRKGAGFWAARALWSLAEGMHAFADSDPEYYERLKRAFLAGVAPFAANASAAYGNYLEVNGRAAPAWFPGDGADQAAILLLGLSAFLELEADETVLTLARQMADGLSEFQYGPATEYPYLAHPSFARDPWMWHAWGSQQTQALARAARAIGDPRWLASAEAEAGNFFVYLLASQGPVESMQPAVKAGPQIAFGMESIASGLYELHATTGKEVYAELAGLMTGWLFGNNDVREPMYDPASGRIYDGLERGIVNRNSGAESTITGLMALVQAAAVPAAAAQLQWQWLWRHDDVVLELETGHDFGEPPAVEFDGAASGQLVALLPEGASVVVDAEVPVAGAYRVEALYRDDPWESRARVALGRDVIGRVTTGGVETSRQQRVALGTVELEAGSHRFVVSHESGREVRFDALVLRPLVAAKLYGSEGRRLLLLKSWAEEAVELDTETVVGTAVAGAREGSAPSEWEISDLRVRVYDATADETSAGSLTDFSLPATGFALIDFSTSEPLPDLSKAGAAVGVTARVEVAFTREGFTGLVLDPLFNNDAFSDPRYPAKGNFDARSGALGATYPAEHAPEPGSVVLVEGVPVLFPPSLSEANNVSAMGQRLEFEPGAYETLWILGSSEQGNYREALTLLYADGSSQTLELGLSDWCQLPRYGESVAYEFTQRRGATGAVERITCRIYLQKVPVDPARDLVGIDLPDRETMHVFAVTLEEP